MAQNEDRTVETMHLKYIDLLEKRINQLEVLVNKPADGTATAWAGENNKAKTDVSTKVRPPLSLSVSLPTERLNRSQRQKSQKLAVGIAMYCANGTRQVGTSKKKSSKRVGLTSRRGKSLLTLSAAHMTRRKARRMPTATSKSRTTS